MYFGIHPHQEMVHTSFFSRRRWFPSWAEAFRFDVVPLVVFWPSFPEVLVSDSKNCGQGPLLSRGCPPPRTVVCSWVLDLSLELILSLRCNEFNSRESLFCRPLCIFNSVLPQELSSFTWNPGLQVHPG